MAAVQKKKRKRRLKKNVRYGLYLISLTACFFIVYGLLFSKAYDSSAQDTSALQSADSSKPKPGPAGEVQGPSLPAVQEKQYTAYPDTGEKVATVLLDAGHGGFDGGHSTTSGVFEKDINLKMTKMIQEKLTELNPQLNVILVRDSDTVDWADNEWDDLNYRMELQETSNADYFVSIHCNAFDDPSVRGFEFFINSNDPATTGMTNLMQQYLEDVDGWIPFHSTQLDSRLQLVYMSRIHSILIETGFLTNPEDLAALTNDKILEQAADAIAAALSDYIMQHPDQTDPATIPSRNSSPEAAAQS